MLITQRPLLTEEIIANNRSRFILEPLEPGFGYTIGNSLRRTLLSSIPGAAVTSIQIDGILHEFTAIPGVKEDAIEVIMNIKEIVVSSELNEPTSIYLNVDKAGTVTAKDINVPAGIEIHNPDHVIATLDAKAHLGIEFTVERGRGYVSAEDNKHPSDEIARIPVDSIFTPVTRVSYRVEATRVEQRTDYDRLIIDVETKNSIRPRDAIASASATLLELFGLVRSLNDDAEGITVGGADAQQLPGEEIDLTFPIEDLELSKRSLNGLMRVEIHTVGDLIVRSHQDLKEIKNFGDKSIDEIEKKLSTMGLRLKEPSLESLN